MKIILVSHASCQAKLPPAVHAGSIEAFGSFRSCGRVHTRSEQYKPTSQVTMSTFTAAKPIQSTAYSRTRAHTDLDLTRLTCYCDRRLSARLAHDGNPRCLLGSIRSGNSVFGRSGCLLFCLMPRASLRSITHHPVSQYLFAYTFHDGTAARSCFLHVLFLHLLLFASSLSLLVFQVAQRLVSLGRRPDAVCFAAFLRRHLLH